MPGKGNRRQKETRSLTTMQTAGSFFMERNGYAFFFCKNFKSTSRPTISKIPIGREIQGDFVKPATR